VSKRSAVIVGGGLSGVAAAYTLARAGWRDIIVVERGAAIGGLAGSFERQGRFYPLGYHHILPRDQTLLRFLDLIGARPRVRWRRIRMLFEADGGIYDLSSPTGFLRFPMRFGDKVRFARLMLRAYATRDWSDWTGRDAKQLIDAWASREVRTRLFEPLCRLKFELPCEEVSAAWLGARLSFREGAAPLGYIPHANWTKVLCDGLAELLAHAGIETRLNTSVERLETRHGRITEAVLTDGERLAADVFSSTVPTETYLTLLPEDASPQLASIKYTGLISAVCAAPAMDLPPFYWMNLSSLRSTACAIFRLDALNPSIGHPGEMCLNFVTHLRGRDRPLFTLPQDELVTRYLDDFERVFGQRLSFSWIQVSRVPMYSPIFVAGFRNPPVRSITWDNLYFAGNYRTFPSVASTGTALASGVEAARAILQGQPAAGIATAAVG
jgi:protoporphyrinogen oxidase